MFERKVMKFVMDTVKNRAKKKEKRNKAKIGKQVRKQKMNTQS